MNEAFRFLPWQLALARRWLGARERFAHAWLIHGLSGIGKRQFARAAAASLLCEAPQEGLACGACTACQWVGAGHHPDLRLIRPDALAAEEVFWQEDEAGTKPDSKKNPSREIRVEQLRELHDWFNMATHRGGSRLAVLYPALALNPVSANALLKLLEEPPAHTLLLLVVDAPDRLLPTIVSRCRRLPLPVPSVDDSLAWLHSSNINGDAADWLAAAGGAPLRALELSQTQPAACPEWLESLLQLAVGQGEASFNNLADTLEKQEPREWVDALQRLFTDLLLASVGGPVRYYPVLQRSVSQVAAQASAAVLSDTAQWLAKQNAVAAHPLNARLLVHSSLQRVLSALRAY